MFFVLLALPSYLYVIFKLRDYCKYSCNTQYYYHTTLLKAYFGVIIILISLCTTIYNLVVIRNRRRLHIVPLTTVSYRHHTTATENV
jgi:hypothetical protein